MNKARYKNVDLIAFEAIYETHWHNLYVSAFKILKDKVQASKVVQEVFVGLLNERQLFTKVDIAQHLNAELRHRVLEAISRGVGYESFLDSLTHYISSENLKTEEKEIDCLNGLQLSFGGESV